MTTTTSPIAPAADLHSVRFLHDVAGQWIGTTWQGTDGAAYTAQLAENGEDISVSRGGHYIDDVAAGDLLAVLAEGA